MDLVTGSTGHLGANLVRRLLDDGERIRVLVRPSSDRAALDGLDVEQVVGDLRDPETSLAAVEGCRRVHHCAALVSTLDGNRQHRRDIFECNVVGTRNLLRAARQAGVEKIVVTGSLSAVGHIADRPCNEGDLFDPFEPNLPYGFSKALVEQECWKAAAEGLPVVVAVSCAIIGPNDFKPSRLGQTLIDFARRRLFAYVPGGFEFVSARDMVQGHVLAMNRGRSGQRYIFSTQFLTVDALMNIFEEVTGQRRPRLRLPGPLMSGVAFLSEQVLRFFPSVPRRFTPGAVRMLRMQRRADCTKARTELGYEPTRIADAVREAYEFFVRRRMIEAPASAVTAPAWRG
jgi:nucleoside-diphosphate-sugar epimerase